jgi:hypothetical protein
MLMMCIIANIGTLSKGCETCFTPSVSRETSTQTQPRVILNEDNYRPSGTIINRWIRGLILALDTVSQFAIMVPTPQVY